jgi:glycosyltransferase involved in cell wall biosynthesis
MDILFSVIIPAYNAEKHIGAAIQSVLGQNYQNYELILINDGSTDKTNEVINSCKKKANFRRFYCIEQENKKIAAARNTGLRAATGSWIAFLDADDIWYENKLKIVHETILARPEADLICHDEKYYDKGQFKKINRYGPYSDFINILFESCCLSTSAVTVKREKIDSVGGFSEDPEINGAEDYDLWLRLSRISKINYLHQVLGEYRVSANSISNNYGAHSEHYLQVVKNYYEQFSDNFKKQYEGRFLRRKAMIHAAAGRGYLDSREFPSASYWYSKALDANPFYWKAILGYAMSVLKIPLPDFGSWRKNVL